jgi:hypothetical protein
MRRALMIATVVLVGCVGPGAPQTPVAGPSPSGSPSPDASPGAVEFVLDDSYRVGERVIVRITNHGTHPYRYNSTQYEACNLTYRDETGRRFLIPPGTHCDLIAITELQPGDTVNLFTWDLEECVRDEWGCIKAETLAPGAYSIEGTFRSADGSPPAHAKATFEIIA